MAYYTENGIYNYISKNNTNGFYWTGKSIWILVYGNTYSEPKVITVVSTIKEYDLVTEEERNAIRMALRLTYLAKDSLHVNFVKCNPAETELNEIKYWEPPMKEKTQKILLDEFKARMIEYGLAFNDDYAEKPINDRALVRIMNGKEKIWEAISKLLILIC